MSSAEIGAIEVDDRSCDSSYEESIKTETQSLTSSVKATFYEHGRRYHARSVEEGKYTMPNDEAEQDRLDLYHHTQLLLLNSALFVAPIGPSPQRILDIGTGTGIWAIDIGDAFPSAEVTGTDLSPIQPTWVPPNVRFEIDDLESDWTFSPDSYDFIHARQLGNSVKSFPRFCAQALRTLKPGAWLEIAETQLDALQSDDGTYNKDTALWEYFTTFADCAGKAGIKLPNGEDLKKVVEEAGFVDVEVKTYIQPWGTWPKKKELKKIGAATTMMAEKGLEAYALQLFTTLGGRAAADVQKLCADAVEEVLTGKVHAYSYLWHIIGRKPEKA